MADGPAPAGAGPLAGLRVLDLTLAMAGPMCTQRLAEMGADVIKVEAPGGGDFSRAATMGGVTGFGDGICFVALNRAKRSLVVDLKRPEGREAVLALARGADVLVQNYRPGVAARLGVDHASLAPIAPRLVYGSISGYGEDGPMAARPGQDLLLQAFSGLTFNGGVEGGLPQASPLYMVDVTASHMLCEGILAALLERSVTGRGREVRVSMLGAIMEMQAQEVTAFLASPAPPRRSRAPQVSIWQEPPYGLHACRTGVLAIAQADLAVLAEALDLPVLAGLKAARPADADAEALAAWRDRVVEAVAARLREKDAAHWDALLAPRGVWCMVANDYAAFLAHPQAAAVLTDMEHPRMGRYRTVAPGIRFPDGPPAPLAPPPAYGAHSREVLAEAGLDAARIDALVASGVVVTEDGR